MWGHQVSPRPWRAWAVTFISLMSVWCLHAALAAADPLGSSSEQQAHCKLTILGGEKGRLQQAGMRCTGTTKPMIAINSTYLSLFQDKFTGVNLVTSCTSKLTEQYTCLITFCSRSVKLRDSEVSMVQGLPLRGLVCVARDSRLEVYDSVFSQNHVRPVMIGDQASVVLHRVSALGNTVDRSGGAMWVEGNASVTITSASRLEGNSAGLGGGGLCVVGNARVVVDGASIIGKNTAVGGGGGLEAVGNARVAILGGCILHGNKAMLGGGGVLVGEAGQVAITNCSVHGNTAGRGGGGLLVLSNATLMIAGSSISNNTATWGGGGVGAEANSIVTISGCSIVQGNTAGQGGGGLVVLGSARVDVASGSNITNNSAAFGGGGVGVWGSARVAIKGGCHVQGNRAKESGGGVTVGGSAQLVVTNTSVNGNTASQGGGGLEVVYNATVRIVGSSSINNIAALGGGGLLANGNADVTLSGGSSVQGNMAGRGGGGLVVLGSAHVDVAGGSNIINNLAATSGGGVDVWGTAHVAIIGGCRVHGNRAKEGGGGVSVGEGGQLVVTNISVNGNTASRGGGFQVLDNASIMIADSIIINNSVAQGGGGLQAEDSANVTITGGSIVHENRAGGAGGGLIVLGNASMVVANGSSISNNTAGYGGGGLQAWDSANVTINGDCSVHGNRANQSGGGVLVSAGAQVTIIRSMVASNTARWSGGGVYAGNASHVTITSSSMHGNDVGNTGGGVYAQDRVQVTITNSSIHDNIAQVAGGGLLALMNATVLLAGGSRIYNNQAVNGSGGGLLVTEHAGLTIGDGCSIVNNSCIGGVGGGIAVGMAAEGLKFSIMGRLDDNAASVGQKNFSTRVIIVGSTITNNTSHRAAGGGLAAVSKSHVSLINGTRVVGNMAINGSGGAVMVMGYATLEADPSVLFANNSVPLGFVGSTIVAFDNSKVLLPPKGQLTKCNSGVYLGRTPCGKGELLQHDVCVCCPPHTFSFDNKGCAQCPPNAACPGASIVEPLPGFWVSSPTSVQMHRCPLFKIACDFVDQTQMCKPGYRGPLCGECQLPKYGTLSPMRCGLCMRPSVQLALFLLLSFVTVLFVWYTEHATWQDNLKGTQDILMSDRIKVLVQYLQYIGIIGGVSVPWSLFDVQQWLQALGIVATVGAGQALSLDCWLNHYLPQVLLPIAILRILVYILAPVVTLVLVLALEWLTWAARRWLLPMVWQPKEGGDVPRTSPLVRKLPVTVMVLGYYSYPTLARVAFSFFACLDIDKPLSALSNVPAGATAPLSHRWGYWVSSISQECFSGYHLRWSLGLGLPFVLLWCVFVPVFMGVGLHMCKGKANNASFREHFGFLYRTYRPGCMWWEAVWVARTVVLTLISVFTFPMQRYFSVLCLLLVFWASAVLQLYFRPYAQDTLHHMHMVSTACLAATTFGVLAMFAYDVQDSTAYALRVAITVLVFVINLGFIGWCLVKLAPVLKEWVSLRYVKVKAWVMNAWDPPTPRGPNRARWRSSRSCFGVC